MVHAYLLDLVSSLSPSSLISTKALIKAGTSEANDPDLVSLREVAAQAERVVTGEPARRFGEIARKERKHRL